MLDNNGGSESMEATIREICQAVGNDKSRMMDIVRAVQQKFGCVAPEAAEIIAAETGAQPVEVEGTVTFYAFLSETPKGKVMVRLCDDVIDEMQGAQEVGEVLKQELGLEFGQTSEDGSFTLEHTPCIGMSDQAPAALINDVVVTNLSTDAAKRIVRELKQHGDPDKLNLKVGDGNNAHPLVQSMVQNNLRKAGPVIFAPMENGTALKKAVAMRPPEVIRELNAARLRGRGGAGFPAGMKWEFARKAEGERKIVVCNADEGEPGTFKDRVILTEKADQMFEGMAIGGYAIGATDGILYLRAEYAYLQKFLEDILQQRRKAGLLGHNVAGKEGFNFDIRIQMGAGAYVCGEETALLSSCEGTRGDPKNRPPFPAQKGYLGHPTIINNVETYAAVARVVEKGAGWFAESGSKGSPGSKVLSISGDCKQPGVYEVPFGTTLHEIVEMTGARNVAAIQVGGPSGQLVPPDQFGRCICYDDLATGGSVMIFNQDRDLMWVVEKFMDFFIEESCGYCTPCRVGNVLLKEGLDKLRDGKGETADLNYLTELGTTVKRTSRCGLGQTSPNPVLSLLENFPQLVQAKLQSETAFQPTFSIQDALADSSALAGRRSQIYG